MSSFTPNFCQTTTKMVAISAISDIFEPKNCFMKFLLTFLFHIFCKKKVQHFITLKFIFGSMAILKMLRSLKIIISWSYKQRQSLQLNASSRWSRKIQRVFQKYYKRSRKSAFFSGPATKAVTPHPPPQLSGSKNFREKKKKKKNLFFSLFFIFNIVFFFLFFFII